MANNRYLIVGCPRSGSTVIHLLLKGHPNIAALNDELKVSPFFTEGISTFTFGNDLVEEKNLSFSVLFDAITSIAAKDRTVVSGAKCICHSPTRASALVNRLQTHLKDLKIILIVRKDLVAQYGSMIHARKSGIYHSWYKGFENRETHQLTINKWLFIGYATNCLDTLNVLRELHKTHDIVECVYEDLLVSPGRVYKQLFDFLDVPQVNVTWLKSKKVMPDPEKYIRNYSEMRSLLAQLCGEGTRDDISTMTITLAKVITRLYRLFNVKERIPRSKRRAEFLLQKSNRREVRS